MHKIASFRAICVVRVCFFLVLALSGVTLGASIVRRAETIAALLQITATPVETTATLNKITMAPVEITATLNKITATLNKNTVAPSFANALFGDFASTVVRFSW